MEVAGIPVSQRWISGVVVSSIGVTTGLMHIDHLLEDLHTMPVVSGAVFPLLLSMGLFYAGYWIATSDYSDERTVSIAVWSLAGAVGLTLIGTTILFADILVHHHSFPATGDNTPFIILPSCVTEGTAAGLMYGVYKD